MAISPEERTLIGQAVKRDREAFSKLYVQFYDGVFRRVVSIVRNREEAEDITNETFLRAWNAIDRFQDRDVSILAWLCTIGERLAFKQAKKRRPHVALDDLPLEAGRQSNPHEAFEQQDEMAAVASALLELPETQRFVLSKRFIDDLSYDDVGLSLGKPVGTVRVIQHRALKALKGLMAEKNRQKPLPYTPTGGPQ